MNKFIAFTILTFSPCMAHAEDKDLVKKELEKLQGTWKLVSCIRDGKQHIDDLKNLQMFVKGTKYTLFDVEEKVETTQTFTIDPTQKPKWVTDDDKEKYSNNQGIYEVDGDTLRVCFGKNRPTTFKSVAGSEQNLYEFKRVKK